MKRGRKVFSKKSHKEKQHKRHHKVKLATLFTAKMILVVLSFTVGLYLGAFTKNIVATFSIALVFGATTYLFTVIKVIKYLEL